MRILVVDDEPLVARTLGLIFGKSGFTVDTALSADEALASLTRNPPDIVLSDIEMPGRDGISLMQDIARELPQCPILILTGSHAVLARVHESAATLRHRVSIVTKPCQPVELLRTAGEMLKSA